MIKERYISTIENLYQLFSFLNLSFFEKKLPEVLLTIEPRAEPNIRGYFRPRPNRFRAIADNGYDDFLFQINISFESLSLEWIDISAILLHEMAHLYDHLQSGSTKHDAKFSLVCEKVGLSVQFADGEWKSTSLLPESRNRIFDFLHKMNFSSRPLIYRKP